MNRMWKTFNLKQQMWSKTTPGENRDLKSNTKQRLFRKLLNVQCSLNLTIHIRLYPTVRGEGDSRSISKLYGFLSIKQMFYGQWFLSIKVETLHHYRVNKHNKISSSISSFISVIYIKIPELDRSSCQANRFLRFRCILFTDPMNTKLKNSLFHLIPIFLP